MEEKNLDHVQSDEKWIFLALGHDDALSIHFWISRYANTAADDKCLAKHCDEIINEAFERAGLQYDSDRFGEVTMERIRLYSGRDGIAIPEKCFLNPKEEIVRIASPLRMLAC